MSTKRILSIVLVAGAVLLAVGIGPRFAGTARALPPAQEPEPPGATISYPGHLTDEAGQPVADGAYAFTFALYDAPDGGSLLWSETQTDVAVQGGAFTALLGSASPLPAAAKDDKLWLAVGVRGPGESEFTLLSPRQQLNAAAPLTPASPAAGPACAHDHLGEEWPSSGSYSSSTYALMITNSGAGDGIRAYTQATASNYAAFYGENTGAGTGVYGYSSSGDGVGGYSSSGDGVYGVCGTGDGVHGQASAATKSGVYGHNTGSGYGVYGRSTSGYGGFFIGAEHYDLGLGGAVGRINTDPSNQNSQLYLSSNADVWVKLDNDSGEFHAFRVKDSEGVDRFTVDEDGNCSCTGTKPATVKTANQGWRQLYSMESPEVWFEDFGTASLVDGETTVGFEPVFAETVNLEEEYHVFVTPLCQEPVLLFVTDKSATGFTVQGVTLDGESAACAFDYRVVAKRLGYEDLRLEATTWQESE
jgi:hypothetical protein